MTFISEMLPIAGARVVGPLPSPLGSDTTYEAAVVSSSGDRTAAAALIEALTRPDARDLWKDAGFEQGDEVGSPRRRLRHCVGRLANASSSVN
jgi:ABC-type molybdate transport system substrate-binding protein